MVRYRSFGISEMKAHFLPACSRHKISSPGLWWRSKVQIPPAAWAIHPAAVEATPISWVDPEVQPTIIRDRRAREPLAGTGLAETAKGSIKVIEFRARF
jgi:hypothetical protein